MTSLLNDIVDRRLRLVEALTYSEGVQSLASLSRDLDLPHRTLTNDIQLINSDWPRIHIDLAEDLVRIHYRPGTTITDVYRDVLKEEPIFSLIQTLILKPNLSRQDLAKEAAMSEASLYRNVGIFNASGLGRLGLSIATNPFRLEGPHESRLLFSSIFLYKQMDIEGWPFPDYPREEVNRFVRLMLESTGMEMDFAEFRMMTFYVVLGMVWAKESGDAKAFIKNWRRERKTHDSHKRDTLASLKNRSHYLRQAKTYEEVFDFPMSLASLVYLYSFYFQREYFSSYQGLLNMAMVDSKINASFFYLTRLLDRIEDDYGVKPDDRHELVRDLHNTLYAGYVGPDMVPFFYRISDRYSHLIGQSYPKLYADIRKGIEGYFDHMDLEPEPIFMECCLYSLLMKWGRLFYRKLPRGNTLSLLIISSIGHAHALSLRDLVQAVSYFPLHISIYDKPTFRWKEVLEEGYDVIWTNLSLPASLEGNPDHPFRFAGTDSRIVLFNFSPKARDLNCLRAAINDAIQAKEEGPLL